MGLNALILTDRESDTSETEEIGSPCKRGYLPPCRMPKTMSMSVLAPKQKRPAFLCLTDVCYFTLMEYDH